MTALFSAVLLTACGDDDAAINEAAKGSISLTGTARVNETLSIENAFTDRNGIVNITASYQWYGNGSAIADATEATYKLSAAELEQDVHVKIDFLDDDGFAETINSDTVNIYEAYKLSMVLDRKSTAGISNTGIYEQSWTEADTQPVSSSGEVHTTPSIAADEKGKLIAVTTSVNGDFGADSDIVFTRSTDNGLTWSNVSLLIASDAGDANSDVSPVIATDKSGNWIVVWSSDRTTGATGADFDIFYSVSTDDGEQWGDVTPLNEWAAEDTHDDSSPQVSINANNWVVTWSSAHDPNTDSIKNPDNDTEIYSSFSSDGSIKWNTPKRISKGAVDNDTADTAPKMHINSSGKGLVIWTAEDEEDGDNDVYAARTTDFGDTWVLGFILNKKTASTDAVTDNEEASGVYTLADGTYVVVWHGFIDADVTNQGAFFASSTNNGLDWSDTKIIENEAGINEITPNVIAKPNGDWFASWVDQASGKVWVVESEDLATWSAVPVDTAQTSSGLIDWIIH